MYGIEDTLCQVDVGIPLNLVLKADYLFLVGIAVVVLPLLLVSCIVTTDPVVEESVGIVTGEDNPRPVLILFLVPGGDADVEFVDYVLRNLSLLEIVAEFSLTDIPKVDFPEGLRELYERILLYGSRGAGEQRRVIHSAVLDFLNHLEVFLQEVCSSVSLDEIGNRTFHVIGLTASPAVVHKSRSGYGKIDGKVVLTVGIYTLFLCTGRTVEFVGNAPLYVATLFALSEKLCEYIVNFS